MEAVGTAAWTTVNSAVLTKDGSNPHGGTQSLMIARDGTHNSPQARQTILTIGQTYRIYGYTRSDGSALPQVVGGGVTGFTGTASTAWQPFDFVFVATTTTISLNNTTSTGTQYVEFDDVTVAVDNAIRPDSILSTLDGNMETALTASGTATAGSSTTLTDSGKAFTVNGLTGQLLTITSGTGANQTRTVTSNTATVITTAAWTVTPDNTSVYQVIPYWTSLQTAAISKQTTSPHGGTYVLRVTRSGQNGPAASQIIFVTGKKYRITGFARSDGNASPRVGTSVSTSNVLNGTTSTSWQPFDATIIADSTTLWLSDNGATVDGWYCEFDDITVQEVDPLVGNNGTNAANVTVGAAAGGHLTNAYSFNGTANNVNIYSSDLNSAFNPNEGTLVAWAKVSGAGVWTDATTRVVVQIQADSNNLVLLTRTATNNNLRVQYKAGGTSSVIDNTSLGGNTGWIQTVITWSKSNDQVKMYLNGSQVGSTQTGLGIWVGNLLSTTAHIGTADSVPNNPWSGLINDVRLYTKALTAAEVLTTYNMGLRTVAATRTAVV